MSAPESYTSGAPVARSSVSARNRRPQPVAATTSPMMNQPPGPVGAAPVGAQGGYFNPGPAPTSPGYSPAAYAPAPTGGFQGAPPTHAHGPVAHATSPHVPVLPAAPRPTGKPTTQQPYQPSIVSAHPGKLDPRTLPNPSSAPFIKHQITYNTNSFGNPPPAYSKYFVEDRGSCSPRFMRSTMSQIPNSASLLNQTTLPMALVVQPLADVGVEEEEVPEIDMGEAVIRCGRCSAYINPFVKFVENGRGYICPFCSTLNSVPEHYFSPIEANGYRRDIAERYELWRGSVDFVAPSEYTTRSKEHSEAPVVLFVIDTSSQAISSGLLKAFVNSARQILEANFTENPNTLFGFITYNKSVQFWRINPTLQAVVVPHVTHVFLPLPSSCFLANYASQRNLIDTFFNEVQSMFSSTGGSGEVAMGAAVNAAMLAFGKHAGRIVLLQNALPQHGPGALKNREEVSSYGKDAEKAFYVPQNKFYSTLGEDCAKRSIQIDLISTGSGYSDLASISELARVTGGHVYYIPGFSIDAHEEKLYYDLFRILTRAHGTEAIGRLRTSEGLVVDSYQGHFLRGDGDVEFGGIDADQTLVIVLKHDGKIEEKKDAFVQFAMVHTNDVGKRLIRVHTLAMHTTNVVSNLFKSSDVSAVFDVLLRRTINNMGKESVQALRTEITSATSSILASYRKYCTKNDRGDAQLILPEALKLLPVHVLGSLKSILFSNPVTAGDSIPSIADARVYMSHLVQTSSLESLIPLFYPRIYGIHKLHRQLELERLKAENKANEANGENESDSEDDEENSVPLPGDEDHYGSYWLPGLIRASASELEAGGVYLMDDGQSIYLALHPPMDSNIFQRLFNENGQLAYNEEDELNRRLWKIIEAIRYRRPNHQLVQLLDTQQNTALRRTFYSRFIEDGSDDYMNREQITTLYKLGYSGYLCHVHRAVQDKI